jgi:hypothetical protein
VTCLPGAERGRNSAGQSASLRLRCAHDTSERVWHRRERLAYHAQTRA